MLKLKVTKFLIQLSQFKSFVSPDKNIFVYKLFLSLNISDFILSFMKKLHPQQKGRGREWVHYLGAIGITYIRIT